LLGLLSPCVSCTFSLPEKEGAEVIETYRMLGKDREDELLREAQRLQAGEAARGFGPRASGRQLDALRGRWAALLTRLRGAMPRPASTAE
jgi:hypothetical protein